MEHSPPHDMLATRLATLQQTIEKAAASRLSASVAPILVAAGKTQPTSVLEQAISLGVRHFGENRVQEAQEKWPALKQHHPKVCLHLIGPLQSNKAADAVALFDVIETIDREKIADAVADEIAKQNINRECFIQVNIGEESQKHGVRLKELEPLLHYCRTVAHLPITGLMAVPPANANPAPYFALLAKLAKEYGLKKLSMGMSHDFETAIRLGATHVRIGTALFGERQ